MDVTEQITKNKNVINFANLLKIERLKALIKLQGAKPLTL